MLRHRILYWFGPAYLQSSRLPTLELTTSENSFQLAEFKPYSCLRRFILLPEVGYTTKRFSLLLAESFALLPARANTWM